MKTKAVIVVGLAAALAFLLGADQPAQGPSVYTDTLYGFTVEAPRFPKAAANTSVVPIAMHAPIDQAFVANVRATVQRIATSRQDFRQLSLAQFKVAGWRVNLDTDVTVSGREAVVFDYEGTVGGRALRWLALAVIDKEQVYLLTCTATKDTFSKYEKAFRDCVDSFKLTD